MGVTSKSLDFRKVKDGGGQFSKKRKRAGDFLAKVTQVADAKSKSDGVDMWLFTVQLDEDRSATYPYYCKHEENQLWKLRNLLVAAGINVPKKKMNVDPSKVLNKLIAVTLDDTEYEGKSQSEIVAIFPAADLEAESSDSDDEDDDEEEEDDEEEVEEDDDDEDEDDEDSEDEEEEEEEEPAPKKKRSSKKASNKSRKKDVDEDELEELEIEDL